MTIEPPVPAFPPPRRTVKYLQQAGVHANWIKLAEHRLHGNSHVMMMEKNSKQITNLIIAWANKVIDSKKNGQTAAAR